LFVDDNVIVCWGIVSLLVESFEIEVVGEVVDGCEVIVCVVEIKFDVVCLDVCMLVMDGVVVVGLLSEKFKVLMLFYSDE